MEKLLEDVSSLMFTKGLTIAVAESCTGGLISHMLTNIPGSSRYFERGIISYSNNAKMEILGVKKDTLLRHGAVSSDTGKEMADGIRRIAKVDIGLATTGIAGPDGGTKEKPVGLVYLALSDSKDTLIKKAYFNGSRQEIKDDALKTALEMLLEYLKDYD
jgi:nicotinamide-nucleotide amidase